MPQNNRTVSIIQECAQYDCHVRGVAGKAVRGKVQVLGIHTRLQKKIYVTILHTPPGQLNDLPDTDFMEDSSFSDKRTQTLVKSPSI